MQLVSLFSTVTLFVVSTAAYSHHGLGTHGTNRGGHGALKARTNVDVVTASALSRRASGPHVKYTFYRPEESGNLTACGEMANSNSAIVSVPVQQFDNSMCNKQVRIQYKGNSVTAKISDACHGCPDDALDLTPMLFTALDGSTDAGVLWGGSWSRVDQEEEEEEEDKPTSSSRRPDPTTTSKKPEPTTTSTTESESITTSSSKKKISSSTSSEPTSTSESSSTSPSTSSSSSSSESTATPSQTSLPGSIGSLENAFSGFAQLLAAGAQLG